MADTNTELQLAVYKLRALMDIVFDLRACVARSARLVSAGVYGSVELRDKLDGVLFDADVTASTFEKTVIHKARETAFKTTFCYSCTNGRHEGCNYATSYCGCWNTKHTGTMPPTPCFHCEEGFHGRCGGPESGCGCAADGHVVPLAMESGPTATALPTCGGTRCWVDSTTGKTTHSSKSYESCSVPEQPL